MTRFDRLWREFCRADRCMARVRVAADISELVDARR